MAAWLMGGALFRAKPNIKNHALCLLDADTLTQQAAGLQPAGAKNLGQTQQLADPPARDHDAARGASAADQTHRRPLPGGVAAYVKDKLRHVMSELPARENYFWRVYMTGSYTLSCCPNYLREENLAILGARANRVQDPHVDRVRSFSRKTRASIRMTSCSIIRTGWRTTTRRRWPKSGS